jgi:hypothetical protein
MILIYAVFIQIVCEEQRKKADFHGDLKILHGHHSTDKTHKN